MTMTTAMKMNKAQEMRKTTMEQYKLSSVDDIYNMLNKRIQNEANDGRFDIIFPLSELNKIYSKELGKGKCYTYRISSLNAETGKWVTANYIVESNTLNQVKKILTQDGFSVKMIYKGLLTISW